MGELIRRIQGISIGVRLAAITSLVLLLGMGSIGTLSLARQRDHAMTVMRWDARVFIDSMENALRTQMLQGHTQMGEVVDRISRPGGVRSIVLADHRGQIRYATNKRKVGRMLRQTSVPCAGCHGDNGRRPPPAVLAPSVLINQRTRVASAVVPIRNARDCYTSACHVHQPTDKVLGVLQIDLSFEQVARQLDHSRDEMLIVIPAVSVATFLVVLGLAWWWIARPVTGLLGGARRVAEGDWQQPIEEAQGELGELAQAFNKMQDRLQVSQRQVIMSEKLASVGKLAAGVAHEINNPLTGILTFAEDLCDDIGPDDPRREDLQVIHRESMRCREIVRKLLDFARQRDPSLALLTLQQLLDHTVHLVSKLVQFQNVVLVQQLDEDIPEVLGDSGQLQQVLLNLLINAAEAMPNGGQITITGSVDPEQQLVRLDITDTGQGMTEAVLRKIFDPFYSTKGGQGCGLGLAVSWSIIDQHSGRLEVLSTVGQGTTFSVILPAAPDACAPPSSA